ncbi:ParB N-terminal domain-containing protein [Candidatus Nomurabacteria bacterium]|nr:ParB N-terminal domain-containing protein [Candidatus Nomurabacteria bacterium]
MVKIKLTNEKKISINEVVSDLENQKDGTAWATTSNGWSIDYVKHLGEVYGDTWYQGELSRDQIQNILLPQHGHDPFNEDELVLITLDTPFSEVVNLYKNRPKDYSQGCVDNIEYLKQQIKKNGFTSTITLAVINETLKHVDGLHRLVALALLEEEGFEYDSIPVFLCDNTR